MDLLEQICSPELAERLKELEVEQNGAWGYFKSLAGVKVLTSGSTLNGQPPIMSAFTVAELGEMLPEWVYTKKNSGGGEKWTCMLVTSHTSLPKKWKAKFKSYAGGGKSLEVFPRDFYADTEADARAKMLINLIEEKVLNEEEE
jgi:hypothetical protein